MDIPFQYGTLADSQHFVDRVEERKQLKNLLGSGINVMLISPRRWGKSSLVKMAMDELSKEDGSVRVCYIDAFGIRSSEDFYKSFAREVIACASTNFEKRVQDARKFLLSFSPSISLHGGGMDTVSFDLRHITADEDVSEILDLPQKLAQEKGIRIIVCIDEFQQLAFLSDYAALEGKLRAAWQKQHDVSYCLYGSKRHMMLDIFGNSFKPFYRFGQVIFLKKIPKTEWIPFIVKAFEGSGKHISEEQAGRVCDIVECHSWYVQQLCYFLWSETTGEVNDELIDKCVTKIIDTNLPMFQNDCERLTASQIAMLRAVTDGEFHFNAAAVVAKYGLGSSQTITRNKRSLCERDFIDKDGDSYSFTDPIFGLWFRRACM